MSEATAGATWDRAAFVIRERGRWSLCRVDERDPRDVGRDDLVASTDPGPPPAASTPLTAEDGVSPIGPIALLVRDGRLWAFDRATRQLRWLTSCELDVLDGLDVPRRASDVIAVHGPRAADALVALDSAGLVELGTADGGHEPAVALTAEAQVWPSSFVRPDGPWQQLDPTRIPVLPAYVPTSGPPLALGLINALARTWQGGVLNERFDIRPPVTIDEARILLEDHDGPAVLLCSNYMWTSVKNHDLAAWAKARNPATITVHGGPDTPKYQDDLLEFLRLPSVDIAVIGEGEATAIEVLMSLAADDVWGSFDGLDQIDGVAYTDAAGAAVRTPDRSRRAELDSLPSPYLSGEFDDLHPASWDAAFEGAVVIETNRGCPYACAFCDWGSATMSRIRKFDLDRVKAEMRWLADRQVTLWMLADANVGIMARDKEIARHVADLRRETGVPVNLGINTAKNTTKHLTEILQTLFEAGVGTVSSLALQTRDEHVLDTINRSNIAPSQYDQLCATFRGLGLPIMCDFVLGLPGQTSTSFKADLQWAIDHEVTVRAWMCQMLPNAPMNDPTYRAEHQIVLDDEGIVVSTATFDLADHQRMRHLRTAERVFEHFGLLRHVLRWLQWDHGLPAMEVLDDLVARTEGDPAAMPFTSW
ncbi:MAG: B12-binding domain-containing radical SAM protein, partial [Aquihabitans sp.]